MHLNTSIAFPVRALNPRVNEVRNVGILAGQGIHTKMSPRTDPFDLIPMWYIV